MNIKGTHFLAALVLTVCTAALPASEVFGVQKVSKVVAADRVQVLMNHLPVTVRLAHVKCFPAAQAELEKLLDGKTVSMEFADELGTAADGEPYVYIMEAGVNVNLKLVETGAATYDTSASKSKQYDSEFERAAKAGAKAAKANAGAGGDGDDDDDAGTPKQVPDAAGQSHPAEKVLVAAAQPAGKYVAELNGSFYHLATCKKVAQLAPNNRIYFATPEAAEKAGKRPCWFCLADRAENAAFGHADPGVNRHLAQKVGHLIGLKSNPTYFYSPTAAGLKDAAISDMIGFKSLAEAKATGRLPDPVSLRLTPPTDGSPYDPPKAGECIGRAPPYGRPCYRAPVDDCGLCAVCLGLEDADTAAAEDDAKANSNAKK
ncbi:MAG: thermonuclease family protein [Planctomycetota bacterium]